MQQGEEPREAAGQPFASTPSDAGAGQGSGGRLPDVVTAQARTWVTATPYRLPLAVAAVGLVLSAPFGGWRPAESETVTAVVPADSVAAAPFEITLERAYYSPRPSDSFPELDPGQQYVVVLGTLTSHHDVTVESALLGDAIDLQGLPMVLDIYGNRPQDGVPVEPQVYSASDSTALRRIGPGLTYDIGLVYVSETTEMPQELTLEISGHTWRRSAFDQQETWADPAVVAEVVVPLAKQEPPADPEAETGRDGA